MKKLLTISFVLLLCAALLWGCGGSETTETTAPVNPNANVPLYYNLDKGTEPAKGSDGSYTLNFALGNEKKTYTVTDKTLLDELLLLDFVGLQLDGNKITDIVRMPDMPYYRMAWDHYVQSISGTEVTVNVLPGFNSKEIKLTLPTDLPAYDISAGATSFGVATKLQKGDRVSIVADESGKPLFAYVTLRGFAPHEGLLYCEHCKKDVQWMDWISATSVPGASGHYLLTKDVTLTQSTQLGKVQICLDLNGKTVTQSTFGTRIYSLESGGTLSIMDSAGGGTMIPSATEEEGGHARWGLVVFVNHKDSVLNLYSGTLDATNSRAKYGCAVSQKTGTFNMYGGTILGGTSYDQGSCAVSANGNFNMYGGRIVGGRIDPEREGFESEPGGGAIRIIGNTTIYGGTIEGGDSYGGGGVLRVCPNSSGVFGHLVMKGGTITGGKAPQGGGIYVAAGSSITLSGNVKITGNEGGNLYLENGAAFAIGAEGLGENAQIGISTGQGGVFVSDVPEDVDLSKYFVSDDPEKKIVNTGNGSWSLE